MLCSLSRPKIKVQLQQNAPLLVCYKIYTILYYSQMYLAVQVHSASIIVNLQHLKFKFRWSESLLLNSKLRCWYCGTCTVILHCFSLSAHLFEKLCNARNIKQEDKEIFYTKVDVSSPRGLQDKVFFDIKYFLGGRGRENLREMRATDFIEKSYNGKN